MTCGRSQRKRLNKGRQPDELRPASSLGEQSIWIKEMTWFGSNICPVGETSVLHSEHYHSLLVSWLGSTTVLISFAECEDSDVVSNESSRELSTVGLRQQDFCVV